MYDKYAWTYQIDSNSTKGVRYIIVAHILLVDLFDIWSGPFCWSCQHNLPRSGRLWRSKPCFNSHGSLGWARLRWGGDSISRKPQACEGSPKMYPHFLDVCQRSLQTGLTTGMDFWWLVSSDLFWFCIFCFPNEKIPKAKLLYVPRLVELPWSLPTQVEFCKTSEFGRSLRSFITRRGGRYFAMLQTDTKKFIVNRKYITYIHSFPCYKDSTFMTS